LSNSRNESRYSSPEARLAIACLGHELGCTSEIFLPEGLDWERFYQFIEENRLAPHFSVLAKSLPIALPDEVKQKLKYARYQNLLYGDQCKIQVHQVLAALKEAGIQVIVLKGWAVIQWLYDGDHGQRYCDDIDILVPKKSVTQAEELLKQMGYSGMGATESDFYYRYNSARAYQKTDLKLKPWGQFSIGFHWGLLHYPNYDEKQIDTDELFYRAIPIHVAGVQVLELSFEDQLIYTCAHLSLHHRNSDTLLNYYEVATIIHRLGEQRNWQIVVNQAIDWHLIGQLKYVLDQVAQLWSQVIPVELGIWLKNVKISLKDRLIDWLVAITEGHYYQRLVVKMIAVPGWKNKFQAMSLMIFPDKKSMSQRFGVSGAQLLKIYWVRFFKAVSGFFRS
jgi:hypothetical protein